MNEKYHIEKSRLNRLRWETLSVGWRFPSPCRFSIVYSSIPTAHSQFLNSWYEINFSASSHKSLFILINFSFIWFFLFLIFLFNPEIILGKEERMMIWIKKEKLITNSFLTFYVCVYVWMMCVGWYYSFSLMFVLNEHFLVFVNLPYTSPHIPHCVAMPWMRHNDSPQFPFQKSFSSVRIWMGNWRKAEMSVYTNTRWKLRKLKMN